MPGPMMRRGAKKEKFDAKSFKKILVYCKPYLPAIIISLICAVVGSITTIIGPTKIEDLINIILEGIISSIDMQAFVRMAVTLLVIYITGAVFNYAQQFIMANVTQKTSKNLCNCIVCWRYHYDV